MRQKNPQSRPAFTLFELLLVLALMAIVVSMAAPSFSAFGRGRDPEYAAARFVALTHWTRSQAISEGATYRINIDEVGRKWWIESQKQGVFEAVSMSGMPYVLPENVTIQTTVARADGYPAIVFEPTGRTTTGDVTIAGQRGDPIVIACKNAAGVYAIAQDAEVRK